MARLDEDVAALQARALDPGEVHRHALAGFGPVDLAIVHLDASRARAEARGLDPQLVARADRARPERPGDDGPDTREAERAVDVEPRRPARPLVHDRGRAPFERGAQIVEPVAGLGAHGDDLRLGNELLRLGERELERLLVDGVRLRHRDDASVDAEQAQDREVLVRLRPRALARVDHEQEEVDPGRTGDHRPHEPLVPGDVDEREPLPARQLQLRVAELDRDPARLLLGQPVGVLAGQRADEPGLAVVDVTCGPDGQRHQRRDLTMIRHGFSSPQISVDSSSGRKPRVS